MKMSAINASRPATVPTTAPMIVFVLLVVEGLGGGGEVDGALAGACTVGAGVVLNGTVVIMGDNI